jgi:hypothetical protein
MLLALVCLFMLSTTFGFGGLFRNLCPQGIVSSSRSNHTLSHSSHLIVLCNGIFGHRSDLSYIAGLLKDNGFVVLESAANEFINSLHGLEKCSEKLEQEILEIKTKNPQLTDISFVGNSLGGLFARHTAKRMFNNHTNLIAELNPKYFMVSLPSLKVFPFISDFFTFFTDSSHSAPWCKTSHVCRGS